MAKQWEIYDRLIDAIDPEIKVVAAANVGPCSEVTSSENSIGRGLLLPTDSRPALFQSETMVGEKLRDIASLAKSWNFAEASFGVAAINAWWGQQDRVAKNGFLTLKSLVFRDLFDPYAEAVAGKKVGVIGHFPFVYEALPKAGEICILERQLHPGDYPDSACEYLLPECDYVFISGSAFVNKTMPRLLQLCQNPYTIVVGPSTACAPFLLDYGVDEILGFSSTPAPQASAAVMGNGSMYGKRVILAKKQPV